MNVWKESVEILEIAGAPGLDPIRVIFKDGQKSTRIIIECYCKAWVFYFGSIGDQTGKSFFNSCHNEYLINRVVDISAGKAKVKAEAIYLSRIIEAIKDGLKMEEAEGLK
jgi:hypothetical protein